MKGPIPDPEAQLMAEPFPAVAPNVRVLMGGDPVEQMGSQALELLGYSINPYLNAFVGYRPDPASYQAMILQKRHAQAWGITKQDIWAAALANMAYDQYEVHPLEAGGDTGVNAVHGLTWLGSAHLMRLPDVMREPAPFGAIAMLPEPNTLLYAVLRSKHSNPVLPVIYRHFQRLCPAEGPVTDQLLFWRHGRVSGMSTRPGPDGAVQIRKSPEFTDLLERELPG